MRRTVTEVKLADARALLRLCNTLHESPGGPPSRKRLLLEGLCDLLDADAGVCVVSRTHDGLDRAGDGDQRSVVSIVRWAVSDDDARALASRYRPHGPAAPTRASDGVRRGR